MKRAETNAGMQAGGWQGLVLVLTSVFPVMGMVLISPNLPALNAQFGNVDGGAYLVSIALTVPALCIAVLAPFAGLLVDRTARVRLLRLALLVYGLVGVAPVFLDDIRAIIVVRACLGVTEAVIMTTVFVLIGSYFHGHHRGRWLAYTGAFAAFGATLLYAVGGALSEYGWRVPFAAYSASILLLPLTWLLWEPVRASPASVPSNGQHGSAAPQGGRTVLAFAGICAMTVGCSVAFYIIPLQMGVFLHERSAASGALIGTAISVASLGNPLGALLYRFLQGRAPFVLIGGCLLVSGVGLAGMTAMAALPVVIAAAFVNQVGCGLMYPVLSSWAMSLLPAPMRGRGGGVFTSAFFAGQFLCPLMLISLTRHAGALGHTFLWVGLACVAAGVVLILAARLGDREAAALTGSQL